MPGAGSYPVVVIGMHRSGTTVVSKMLRAMGVETGRHVDPNEESWPFLRISDALLNRSGGSWDNPEPLLRALTAPDVREQAVELARQALRGRAVRAHLGWSRWVIGRGFSGGQRPWGWKDPRATWTLPIWEELFPGLRIIHVERAGLPVARSLVARQHESIQRQRRWLTRANRTRWLAPSYARARMARDPLRAHDIDSAVDLWHRYVRAARAHAKRLDDRALTIQYEDLVNDPQAASHRLAGFCAPGAAADARTVAASLVRQTLGAQDTVDVSVGHDAAKQLQELGYAVSASP